MIIKDFINKFSKNVSLTPEWIDNLFKTIIPNGVGEILDLINLNEAVLEKTLTSEDTIALPMDFGYPIDLIYGDTTYDRVQLSHIADSSNTYAILLNSNQFNFDQPLITSNILSMNVYPLRSRELEGYRYEVRDINDNVLATLYDNENIFYPQALITDERQIKIVIVPNDDINRVRDNDELEIKTREAILKVSLRAGVAEYFLAEDGTAYSDVNLTTLISRPKPIKTNYILKLNSAISGDIKFYYKTSKPYYVNRNEDEPLIDQYYTALKNYCLKEIYEIINKPQLAMKHQQSYVENLRVLSSKKGKIVENRVERQVTPNANVFRSKATRNI